MNLDEISQKSKRYRHQGETVTEVSKEITRLYNTTTNGIELAAALKKHHYSLVKSTRKVIFVIDRKGGEHNLFSRIAHPREEVKIKLADLTSDDLPLKKSREREIYIKCYLSPDEKSEIETRAEKAELSLSGYLYSLVFGKNLPHLKVSRRPSPEKEELVALRYELRKIGEYLNQMTYAQNQSKEIDPTTLAKLLLEHEAVLKAIMVRLNKK